MSEIAPSAFDLEADKFRLRPLQEGDKALAFCTDARAMRFIGPPLSAEQSAQCLPKTVTRQRKPTLKGRLLVMLDKATLQAVGICGTSQYDTDALRRKVGMVLKPEARAQGIAKEAHTALTKRNFVASSVNEIGVRFSAENLTAKQLVVSVGFTPCADVVREEEIPKTIHYSLHRSSSCAIETTNCQGAGNVEHYRFS